MRRIKILVATAAGSGLLLTHRALSFSPIGALLLGRVRLCASPAAFCTVEHRLIGARASLGFPTRMLSIGQFLDCVSSPCGGCYEGAKTTVLSMGLRSFIRKRLESAPSPSPSQSPSLSPKDGDGCKKMRSQVDGGGMEKKNGENGQDIGSQSKTKTKGKTKTEIGGEATSSQISPLAFLGVGGSHDIEQDSKLSGGGSGGYRETVEERIARIKRGGMTPEEKEAFLNTALDRTAYPPKRKSKGPPIRQRLPLGPTTRDGDPAKEEDEDGRGVSPSGKTSAEASWSSVVARKRLEMPAPTVGAVPQRMELDEASKQAWLNMVTSPTRFQSYRSVMGSQNEAVGREETQADSSRPPPITAELQEKQLQDLSEAKKRLMEHQKQLDATSSDVAGISGDSEEALQASPFLPKVRNWLVLNNTDDGRDKRDQGKAKDKHAADLTGKGEKKKDLATRLEKAAILQEAQDSETRRQLEIQKTQDGKVRQHEQRKLLERQREQEAEFRRQEAAKLARLREKEKRAALLEEEKRKAEEARLKQLQAAQDAYWQKKLQEEKRNRESMNPEEKESENKEWAKNEKEESVRFAQAGEMQKIQMQEVHRESERKVMDKAKRLKEENIEHAKELLEESADRASKDKDFLQQQADKLAELEKLVEERRLQLSDISSPLPALKDTGKRIRFPEATSGKGLKLTQGTGHRPGVTTSSSSPMLPDDLTKAGASVDKIKTGIHYDHSSKLSSQQQDASRKTLSAPSDSIEAKASGPIRQKLPLSVAGPPQKRPVGTHVPIVGRSGYEKDEKTSAPTAAPAKSDSKLKISEEERKKANKWGINIDKFL